MQLQRKKHFFGRAALVLALTLPLTGWSQTLFAPSSATASNEIGGDYGVQQTINGGGLVGTDLTAVHALVTNDGYESKFWISTAEATLPITLTYNFSASPTLSGVAIWNAVFQLPLEDTHYTYDGAPSSFDLEVVYAGGTKTYSNVPLSTTLVAGQRFDFCENLAGVGQIRFIVKTDTRPVTGSDRNVYLSEFRVLQEATPSCVNPLEGPPRSVNAVPATTPELLLAMSVLLGLMGMAMYGRRQQKKSTY